MLYLLSYGTNCFSVKIRFCGCKGNAFFFNAKGIWEFFYILPLRKRYSPYLRGRVNMFSILL